MNGNSVVAKASSIPTRTWNKRLSSIPSSSITPISPIAAISSSQLEKSIVSQRAAVSNNTKQPSSLTSRKKPANVSKLSRPGTADSGSRRKTMSPTRRKIDMNSSFDSASTQKSTASTSSKRSDRGTRLRARNSGIGVGLSSSTRDRSWQNTSSLNNSSSNLSASGQSVASATYLRNEAKSPTRGPLGRSVSPTPASRGMTAPDRSVSPLRNPNPRDRSRSPLDGANGRTIRTASPYNTKRGNRSVSPIPPSHDRSLSPMRSRSPMKSPDKSNNPNVFVHGMPEDNSWATQIGKSLLAGGP